MYRYDVPTNYKMPPMLGVLLLFVFFFQKK